jgi:creatinine amidohydrolase/Fe(II)-dependent formamide hydrolase-like protein
MKLANANIPKIAIENPVGIMSREYRKPDQIIEPYQFGHAETKKTCLWLKGLPKLVSSEVVEPDFYRKKDGSYYQDAGGKRYSRIHFVSGRMPAEERRTIRSRTYPGIAAAMADQWGGIHAEN